jgi:hypothetical protein
MGNPQNLSPIALRAKRARDLANANEPYREARRAHAQRVGQNSNSDIHHTKSGGWRRESISWNRAHYNQ